uniref:Major facilitator superfamily (MFS) profile domain-containing protein n=1 Tax=Fibrocapsa japonica TaxID=94617 RepID=A0A7S2V0P8_9STRA
MDRLKDGLRRIRKHSEDFVEQADILSGSDFPEKVEYADFPEESSYGTLVEPIEEEPTKDGGIKNMKSFCVIAYMVLVGDAARGLMFPTLWPLVESLGGDRSTQGYCVAAFSFGRIFASPYFGQLSTEKGYKDVLLIAIAITVVGCLTYAHATSTWLLMVGQCVMGFGAGTLGVTRAYVADNTSSAQRTTYIAYITALQYAGFTVCPSLGAAFTLLLGDDTYSWGPFQVSKFSAPAYFHIGAALLGGLLLQFAFDNYIPTARQRAKSRARAVSIRNRRSAGSRSVSFDSARSPRSPTVKSPMVQGSEGLELVATSPQQRDSASSGTSATGSLTITNTSLVEDGLSMWKFMLAWGFINNIATKGTIGAYETLGAEFAITALHFDSADTGFIFASFGFLGVLALLSMRYLCERFADVFLVFWGVFLMVVSCVLFYLVHVTGTVGFSVAIFVMYSVGYPIGHTALIGLFSKIVGNRPQGALLGWFGSSGSLARIIFPLLSGYVAETFGNSELFAGLAIMLAMCLIWMYLLWENIEAIV